MKRIVDKSMLGKAWVLDSINDSASGDLIHNILANRGIVGDDNVNLFLNPSIKEYMPDPYVLTDMEKTAHIIANAIAEKQKIAI